LFHLDFLALVVEGKGGEGVFCAFGLVDDLKELFAGGLWLFGLAGGLGGGLGDLFVFRGFRWLCELFLFILLPHVPSIVEI
jgi:hypothetical protein